MRKILAILLSVVAGLSFSGCGAFQSDDDPNDGRTRVRISFFKAGFGDEWIKAIAAEYEKLHPDVKIVIEGDESMDDLIRARFQAGPQAKNYPDIVSVTNYSYYIEFVRNGYLENLDSLYETEVENGETLLELVDESFRTLPVVQNSRYGIPWEGAVTGFAYNVKMFKEHGWEIPDTMDEFFALCEQIKGTGVNPVVYAGAAGQGYFGNLYLSWFAQYEGKESTEEFFRFENSDVYRKEGRKLAYEQIAKIVADPDIRMAGSNGMGHLAAQRAFIRGEAAMIPSGSWLQSEMSAFLEGYPNFEMAIFPVPSILSDGQGNPVDKNGNPALTVNTSNCDMLCIAQNSPNKEIAKDFLLFMSRQDMLKLYVEKTGGNPRPLKITNEDWSGLSTFGKSMIEIWQSAYNVFPFSQAELFQRGELGMHLSHNGNFCTYMESAPDMATALARAEELYLGDIETAEQRGLPKP